VSGEFSQAPPMIAAGEPKAAPLAALSAIGSGCRDASTPVFAAIDLGTNNCRLLIATCLNGVFQVVEAFSRIVRLGEGLSHTGVLSPAAQDRAIEALSVCRQRISANGVTHSRLIATEACRAAANGPAFLSRVENECGLKLEIIDRETEARLAVMSCEPLFDRTCRSALLFDIGGGSTELAFVEALPTGKTSIAAWTSLSIGVVSLAERFGGRMVSEESFAAMVEHVARLIDDFPDREIVAKAARSGAFHLLGTSGTVTTIAGVHLGLRRYDRRKVDGLWMKQSDVSEIVERLLSTDFSDRSRNPCIGIDRADLVLAGCAILEAIRDAFPADRLRIADRGLREGILVELMRQHGGHAMQVEAPPAWIGSSE